MIAAAASTSADIPPGWSIVIAALVTVIASAVGGVILFWLRQINKRADDQQRRIEKLERRDRAAWLYIQRLIVSHSRHAPGVPLPNPPKAWLEDDDEEESED